MKLSVLSILSLAALVAAAPTYEFILHMPCPHEGHKRAALTEREAATVDLISEALYSGWSIIKKDAASAGAN
ncbi:hypothetical protein PT974_05014 [Cladobotryum mycophilum]|uniref:Uncharacterized protein n=1 Tax=Cladobotryum mycophilum TaxID=491253 RepID=A0ABR0SS28_9HYPO